MRDKRKRCTRCGKRKSIKTGFGTRSDGHGNKSRCKTCVSEIAVVRNRAWRKANPEKHHAQLVRRNRVTGWHHYLANMCKRTTRLRSLPSCDVDAAFLLGLFEKQRGLCHWLNIPMVPSLQDPRP